MDKYIQKLNFDFLTNQRVMQLIAAIDEYRGKWNVVEKRENRYLKELRKIATIESIGSSTRIEGSTMTDEEVKQLLKDIKITKFQTRDEQEVIGYYDVLELIFDNYSEIKLSESYIKQLHQLLLKHSNKDERHRGGYKHLSNKVVATYPTGEQKVIFSTTEPAFVEGEMFELIRWTNRQWQDKTIHPLIVLSVFIYEFLSIHPFQDGNGRLSRLLTTLFLLQLGYKFMQYISFENHIETHKKVYYDALITAQRKRIKQEYIIDKWLIFFLESLKSLTEKLDKKYDVFKQKGGYLNERQKLIKGFIIKQKTVKISDVVVAFPDISQHTLKKDLQYLKTEQVVSTVGQGKGMVYVINQQNDNTEEQPIFKKKSYLCTN
ncbi:filamentation induced by cAMP protein Fic [Candidatus Symbiothrix dinenymphae]|nr:filamentation induced by cAMP protein Fic [Candidatus Symbiothrix dinenymphae]